MSLSYRRVERLMFALGYGCMVSSESKCGEKKNEIRKTNALMCKCFHFLKQKLNESKKDLFREYHIGEFSRQSISANISKLY